MGSWLPDYYFHNFWDVIYQKVSSDIFHKVQGHRFFFVCLFVQVSGLFLWSREKNSKCWAVFGNIIYYEPHDCGLMSTFG